MWLLTASLFLSSSPSSPLRSLLPLSQVLFRRRRPIASSLAKHPGNVVNQGEGCGTVALSRHCTDWKCAMVAILGCHETLRALEEKMREKGCFYSVPFTSQLWPSDASCAVYRRVLKHESCSEIVFPLIFLKVFFLCVSKGPTARSKQCW